MEVVHAEDAVVLVATKVRSAVRIGGTGDGADEWVVNQTVSGLESDLGLEGILTDRTHHLEWDVGAVEESSVVWAGSLISDTYEVSSCIID